MIRIWTKVMSPILLQEKSFKKFYVGRNKAFPK